MPDTYRKLESIAASDPRYPVEAYVLVLSALEETIRYLGERRHVTGRELCEGIRRSALTEYGMMARTVLEKWGCRKTDDFGNIVARLLEAGIMSRTEQDRLEDFHDVYDFEQAFVKDYVPGTDSRPPVRKNAEGGS